MRESSEEQSSQASPPPSSAEVPPDADDVQAGADDVQAGADDAQAEAEPAPPWTARIGSAIRRIQESTPVRLMALVLVVAGVVGLVVKQFRAINPSGFTCPSKPATHRGIDAEEPTISVGQANAFLDEYAARWGQHDLNGVMDLMDPHVCRYPAGGGPPQSRSKTQAELNRQFDAQAHPSAKNARPHPTVTYQLRRRMVTLGRDQATVGAHYRIFAGKDVLGTGVVRFHLVKKRTLLIDQIVFE